MNRLRAWLHRWWDRVNTLEPLPPDISANAPDDTSEHHGDQRVQKLFRDLPPGAGGSGI